MSEAKIPRIPDGIALRRHHLRRPCSVESAVVRRSGRMRAGSITWIRGGAFNRRTNSRSGARSSSKIMRDSGEFIALTGGHIAELRARRSYVFRKQVGARNFQNFGLLKKNGQVWPPRTDGAGKRFDGTIAEGLGRHRFPTLFATTTWCCASAASARSRRPRASRWTSLSSPCCARGQAPVCID